MKPADRICNSTHLPEARFDFNKSKMALSRLVSNNTALHFKRLARLHRPKNKTASTEREHSRPQVMVAFVCESVWSQTIHSPPEVDERFFLRTKNDSTLSILSTLVCVDIESGIGSNRSQHARQHHRAQHTKAPPQGMGVQKKVQHFSRTSSFMSLSVITPVQ